jgi:hypothetical protein
MRSRFIRGSHVDEHGEKSCSRCGVRKSESEFYNAKAFADGKDPHCKECKRQQRNERLSQNPNYERERYNPDRARENYLKNAEKLREVSRGNWRKYREKYKKDPLWKAERLAYDRSRELTKSMRTPPWLTKEQKREVKNIYKRSAIMSKETGEKHHVDHIAPLMGANVCGLHVPWNLRIVTATENLSKGLIYDGPDGWPHDMQLEMRALRWELIGRSATPIQIP